MEKQATREAYGQALEELGAVRQDVVVLDADLSKSTKTSVFQEKYPERFFNAGIAEQNLMGLAAGFAGSREGTVCKYFCCICYRSCI